VPHSMCGSGCASVCPGRCHLRCLEMHVLDVEIDDQQRLVLTIEAGQTDAACPACGVLAVGHGRRVRVLQDAPSPESLC